MATEALEQLAEASPDTVLNIDGERKVAIALLALGDTVASELIRELPADQVERLVRLADSLEDVTAQEVLQVLESLADRLDRYMPGVSGNQRLIGRAAAEALGPAALDALLGGIEPGTNLQLDAAAGADPLGFTQTIAKEHPQVISLVLTMLTPTRSAVIFGLLPDERQADVIQRLATLHSVPKEVLNDIADAIAAQLTPATPGKSPVTIDGMQTAANLLRGLARDAGSSNAEAICQYIEDQDTELAEELRNKMFTFEDLKGLHPRDVQVLLREVDSQVLARALKTASHETKTLILSNMSTRAAQMVTDDLETLGPTPLAKVEEAQHSIIRIVMELANDGQINLSPGDAV